MSELTHRDRIESVLVQAQLLPGFIAWDGNYKAVQSWLREDYRLGETDTECAENWLRGLRNGSMRWEHDAQ